MSLLVAAAVLRRLLVVDPTHEGVVRRLMAALESAGRRSEAARVRTESVHHAGPEDLPGQPLAWREAMRQLVGQLTR